MGECVWCFFIFVQWSSLCGLGLVARKYDQTVSEHFQYNKTEFEIAISDIA